MVIIVLSAIALLSLCGSIAVARLLKKLKDEFNFKIELSDGE